jgi:DedD protein
MEEKNELNDIILSKSGSNSNSKKLLLAIAALTLILIIVLVIMNSLKTQVNEQPPIAAVPPEPTAPTEIIDDPLFEPVEVIQEGAGNTSAETSQDLGQIAQKIKQESMQNAPKAESVIQPATATVIQQSIPAAPTKITPQPVVQTAPKTIQPVVNTPTIKTAKPAEVKKTAEPRVAASTPKAVSEPVKKIAEKGSTEPVKAVTETAPKTEVKAADTTGTYYIQVGSFSKEPSKVLFDRLNASGLKYTTIPSGASTKVMVGPFQGEKAARDVLGTVKRNIEAGAYITKG